MLEARKKKKTLIHRYTSCNYGELPHPSSIKSIANFRKKKKGARSAFHDVEPPLITARLKGDNPTHSKREWKSDTNSDTGRLKRNGDPDDAEKEMLAEAEDTNERSKGRTKQKLRGMMIEMEVTDRQT